MNRNDDIERTELERRVVFSLLGPAVRAAARFGVPAKDVADFVRVSYLRELRTAGQTLSDAGDVMGISTRSAKRLAQKLRETFFAPEVEHELARRVEFMLWGQPMSRARLGQLLDADDEDLDHALEQLEREERVRLEDGRTPTYHTVRSVTRLAMREGWIARIGSLNSLMENVANTVFGRFFDGRANAFARTLSFRLRDEDVAELQKFYEEQLIPKLTELEERAATQTGTTEMQMSLLWAPFESSSKTGEGDES